MRFLKYCLLTAFSFCLLVNSSAQLDNDIRSAKTYITQFKQNRNQNNLLNQAFISLESAGKSPSNLTSREYWKTRAEFMSVLGNQLNNAKLFGSIDAEGLPKVNYPGLQALDCLYKASEIEGSAASFNAICQLMQENILVLYNESLVQIEYDLVQEARISLEAIGNCCNWLISHDQELAYQNAQMHAASYYLAAGLISEDEDIIERCDLIKKAFFLKHLGNNIIGDLLQCPELTSDSIAALEVIAMPDYESESVQFLYAKINAGLIEGRSDDIFLNWINDALKSNPDGPELLFGASLTHEIRYRQEASKNNVKMARHHFKLALDYIERCIAQEIIPDAYYMAGLVHYNAFAYGLSEVVPDANFDEAQRYFILAEIENPNNLPLLSALEFIYHYKNDFEMAEEFRTRIEKIKSGQSLKSYFQR